MGRKDKLRREKQARQRKKENAAPVATVATTATTATTTTTPQATPAAATTGTWNDDMFPKSEFYVQAKQHNKESRTTYYELSTILFRGATEYGCIHSMNLLGKMYTLPKLNGRKIHEGQPWLLEGSIRGSICGASRLFSNYCKAKPESPQALGSYWIKMMNKYDKWSGTCNSIETASNMKFLKENVVKQCAICSKEDTEILTLRQCIGCSMYCYCSEACQTIHWEEHNHGGECRQLHILNKYHKPYAKEIRKAAIRGETHPALKKLRNKLGLTRPPEECQQLCDTNTYEGKQIDPLEYLVARNDGTVWIGSTSTPFGLSPVTDTATTATCATTTTTTPTARASLKDDEKSHKIK